MEGLKQLKQWFRHLRNGKESETVQTPLVAYAWNGGASTRYEVKAVTSAGAYLVTEDRWYPGTIVMVTMQYDPYYTQIAAINGRAKDCVRMRAKIMKHRDDGAEVRFVYLSDTERKRFRDFLAGGRVRGLR